MKFLKPALVIWMSLIFASSGALSFVNLHVLDGHSHHTEPAESGHHHEHDEHHDCESHADILHADEACCSEHEHLPSSETIIPPCIVFQTNVSKILKLRIIAYWDVMHLVPSQHYSTSEYAISCLLLDTGMSPDRTVILRIWYPFPSLHYYFSDC